MAYKSLTINLTHLEFVVTKAKLINLLEQCIGRCSLIVSVLISAYMVANEYEKVRHRNAKYIF